VSAREYAVIEHLVRKGKRDIELWENPGVKDVVTSKQMTNWERGRQWAKNL
jgi:succinate dehydrogenase assembly factor 1